MEDKLKIFMEKLNGIKNKDIEYGWCKSKLFGEIESKMDDNCVGDRELEIFYVIRKTREKDAPYMIFFNGGPGVGFTDGFMDMLDCETFFPGINVVCMDQRGTGCSSQPGDNPMELGYFTAKYISYDADRIRRKLLGDGGKWLAFGESYGGHIIRKYLEIYPANVLSFISFGYGECSPVNMKVNIQLQMNKLIDAYFKKYPGDQKIIEDLRNSLKDSVCIETENARVCGKHLVDSIAYVFGLLPEIQIHEMIEKLRGDNNVETFIREISFLVRLLLNASGGKLNPVVAYIDLLEGMTDEVLASKVKDKLADMGFKAEREVFLKNRFAGSIVKKSSDAEGDMLHELFVNGCFKAEPVDFKKIVNNIEDYGVKLHIFGSINDTLTPVDAIREEERSILQSYPCRDYIFHYTQGNHREWLYSNDIFNQILSEFIE